jgi:pyrroloquinoline quinone biosynthesis protein B
MELFEDLSRSNKKKINFIHFNHTNPALDEESEQTKLILKNGFSIARFGDTFSFN